MINLADLQEYMRMSKRKEILEQHPYSVWQSENDGLWYTYLPDPVKHRVKRKRSTKREIEDLIVDYYMSHTQKQSIKSVFDDWNDSRAENGLISKSTRDRNTQIFKRHFSKIQDRSISDMSLLSWERFLQGELDTHQLNRKSWGNLRGVFCGIVTHARREGLIGYHPDDVLCDVEIDKNTLRTNMKSDEEDAFTLDEWNQIVNYISQPEHHTIHYLGILLLLVTGLRIGELSTLKYSDIQNGIIHVQRRETRYNGEDGKETFGIIEAPKTEAGKRLVPIPESFLWILDEVKSKNPDGPFLFMYRDKRIKSKGFRNQLYLLCDELGFEHRKSPHKARKTYASILMEHQADETSLIRIMGHSDIKTSECFYHRDIGYHPEETLVNTVNSIPEFQNDPMGPNGTIIPFRTCLNHGDSEG